MPQVDARRADRLMPREHAQRRIGRERPNRHVQPGFPCGLDVLDGDGELPVAAPGQLADEHLAIRLVAEDERRAPMSRPAVSPLDDRRSGEEWPPDEVALLLRSGSLIIAE